jgi:hypothetical protein
MEKRTLSRRKFLLLAGGAASGAVLAGCTQPESEVQIVKETVEVEVAKEVEVTREVEVVVEPEGQPNPYGYVEWHPDEPVEVEFWSHNINDSDGPGAQDRRTIEAFQAMYPNIKIFPNPTGWGGTTEPLDKVAAAFAAGTGTPDVFIMHGRPDICVGSEWALPVTEDMMPVADRERLGYKELRSLSTRGDDRVTELLSLIMGSVLLYNVPIFEEVGVSPDDLGDYIEDAIPVFQELAQVDPDGTVMRLGFTTHAALEWGSWVTQAGGTWFNTETQKFEWKEDEGHKYLAQLYRDLFQTHKVSSVNIDFFGTSFCNMESATCQAWSWFGRWNNANCPNGDYRTRAPLRVKPAEIRGFRGLEYSVGLAVAANIEDPMVERAAIEFWKYVYYNTANQADLGRENTSAVLLKDAPDYEAGMADVPETSSIPKGQRVAELLYRLYEDQTAPGEWVDLGMTVRNMENTFSPMLDEIAGSDRPIEEILEEYEAAMQADWDENNWYHPDVVAK